MTRILIDNASLIFKTRAQRKPAPEQAGAPAVAGDVVTDEKGRRIGIKALADVSLDLHPGDRLGIIGSNGAGKTTLLRMMAGIYAPSSGTVVVEGRVSAMFNLGLGMQLDASGLQNIVLSGLIAGASRAQIDRAIPDIVTFTELGDFLDMPVRTYSQGMAMRLKFACATAFRPEILLLDEWIGAGDADFQAKARERMDALVSSAGIVVLATHNQTLMKRVVNKAIWLEKGHMKGFGPAGEIIEALAAFRRSQGAQNAA
ncbi:MAG: ABC transporter ATP-binding protein [Pseudomonadota bacterium]